MAFKGEANTAKPNGNRAWGVSGLVNTRLAGLRRVVREAVGIFLRKRRPEMFRDSAYSQNAPPVRTLLEIGASKNASRDARAKTKAMAKVGKIETKEVIAKLPDSTKEWRQGNGFPSEKFPCPHSCAPARRWQHDSVTMILYSSDGDRTPLFSTQHGELQNHAYRIILKPSGEF